MANKKSAIKRVEVAERNRLRNRSWKSAVRTARNKVETAVSGGDRQLAATALSEAYEIIDKAVSKGIMHVNSGARKKSALALRVGQAG